MKIHINSSPTAARVVACVAVLAAVALLGATSTALAERNPNPGIVPPHAKSYGQSYGEWAAAWWQWILSVPAETNPNLDPTGEFCGENQAGPVWFLAGTFGDSASRTCRMPDGAGIFFPIYNWIFGAGVFDCEPTVPGVECDVEVLREGAAANTLAAEVLDVTIDDVPVQNVRAYRAFSPEPFALYLPEGNVVGVPEGIYEPNVADGYWLMLAPLSRGEHTIRVFVSAPDTIFGAIVFELVTVVIVE